MNFTRWPQRNQTRRVRPTRRSNRARPISGLGLHRTHIDMDMHQPFLFNLFFWFFFFLLFMWVFFFFFLLTPPPFFFWVTNNNKKHSKFNDLIILSTPRFGSINCCCYCWINQFIWIELRLATSGAIYEVLNNTDSNRKISALFQRERLTAWNKSLGIINLKSIGVDTRPFISRWSNMTTSQLHPVRYVICRRRKEILF